MPGVGEATITQLHDHQPTTAATTSDIVAKLDRDQYRGGDGPCPQATRTGQLVRVSVAEAGRAMADIRSRLRPRGVRQRPVRSPARRRPAAWARSTATTPTGHGFADLDEKLLDLFTIAATAALCAHARYLHVRDTARRPRAALTSRAVIDLAEGTLMAIRQINADDAFTLLVEQSQREDVKIHDLATRLVSRTTGTRS